MDESFNVSFQIDVETTRSREECAKWLQKQIENVVLNYVSEKVTGISSMKVE